MFVSLLFQSGVKMADILVVFDDDTLLQTRLLLVCSWNLPVRCMNACLNLVMVMLRWTDSSMPLRNGSPAVRSWAWCSICVVHDSPARNHASVDNFGPHPREENSVILLASAARDYGSTALWRADRINVSAWTDR